MTLGGKIRLNVIDPGPADTGEHTVTILRSDDVVTASGLSVDSAVAQGRLVQPSPHEVALVYDIDFANPGILRRTNFDRTRFDGALGAEIFGLAGSSSAPTCSGPSPATAEATAAA